MGRRLDGAATMTAPDRLIAPGRRPKPRGWALPRLLALQAILAAFASVGCATVSRADYTRAGTDLDVLADLDVSGWPVQVSILDDAGTVTVCAASAGQVPTCVQASKR